MFKTVEEAEAFLATCERDVLADYTFGDEEVYWFKGKDEEGNPVEVACGYFGRSGSEVGSSDLPTDSEEQKALRWRFVGSEADKLQHCGKIGSFTRNDG